jgi:peptidyl-prolyl cis-trans isomerase C
LAALINDEAITLAEFQAELGRYRQAQEEGGLLPQENAEEVVLSELIDQVLLAQAARQAGFVLGEADLGARIDQLAEQSGGGQALADWLSRYGYSEADFRTALARSLAAAWMRDQVVTAAPETAEQVHARQILLYNDEQAQQVYDLLQSGQDFTALAYRYDPLTGGELGWFPRGYLLVPAVEEAAFNLQPGEYTPVIKTEMGYHIVQVIERDPLHPLEPDARWTLQVQALQEWLTEKRNQSEIQVLYP